MCYDAPSTKFFSWQKQVWTYPVFEENMFGDRICEIKRMIDSGSKPKIISAVL